MFGPAIGSEPIVGRVWSEDTAWLATAESLVRIDFAAARYTRVPLHPLDHTERARGLARTVSGQLWALVGQTTLAAVGEDGVIARRITLGRPYANVFGAGRELVFPVLQPEPQTPALEASAPGGASWHAWSRMRTRGLTGHSGVTSALSPASCGASAGTVLACWFPHEPALTLTDTAGHWQNIALEGLIPGRDAAAPSDAAYGPRLIYDALVATTNALWVLGSGVMPTAGNVATQGGWLLARYDHEGRLFRRVQLPEPARVILKADDDACVLLAWDGHVIEVRP